MNADLAVVWAMILAFDIVVFGTLLKPTPGRGVGELRQTILRDGKARLGLLVIPELADAHGNRYFVPYVSDPCMPHPPFCNCCGPWTVS